MSDQPFFLSKEKKEELEAELNELQSVKRKEIIEALEYSKSLGDLSENAEYHQAREAQAKLEDRVREIEHILQNASIVSKQKTSNIGIGSTVLVRKKGAKTEKVFELVGEEEGDSESGKISHKSPIGQALIGKTQGDEAKFETPKGKVTYEILKVS